MTKRQFVWSSFNGDCTPTADSLRTSFSGDCTLISFRLIPLYPNLGLAEGDPSKVANKILYPHEIEVSVPGGDRGLMPT